MTNCCETSRIRRATIRVAILVTAILPVFFNVSVAQAQGNGPGFHVSAGGDLNCPGGEQAISQATAPATVGPSTFPCTSGQRVAAAEAGAGSLRVLGRAEHTCCGTASGANGRGRIQIDNVVITGPPAASIPVSLNFRLRGTLTGSTNFGQHGVFLFLRLAGFNTLLMTDSKIEANHLGILNQSGVFAPLTIGFPNATIDQTLVTPVANAAPNQPLMLEMQLQAASAMAGEGFTEADFFSGSNGLFLPFGTPVFNLPPGYTVNIPELNIINNFVVLPAILNGDLFIVGTTASEISAAGVTEVTGSVGISDNNLAQNIDLPALERVGGSVDVTGNNLVQNIDLPALERVGGSVDVTGNNLVQNIDLPALERVGGSVDVTQNHLVQNIDLPSLTTVDGSVDVTQNNLAQNIDLPLLTNVGGSVSIFNNGLCTNVILGLLTAVVGNLTVESCGTGTFTPGPAAPGGNTSLTTNGYTVVNGTTAAGITRLSNKTAEALMTVQLPAGSFATPVSFSLTRLDPATLTSEPGFDANNAPATIDPVAAYQFTFGVPTLNQNATLSFDVFLNNLDTLTADALLAAVTNGSATLATRGDAAGSQYQAFPICAAGQQPSAGGCVLVQLLDANGQPTTGTPAIVRFSNVVGHFSTWAVAIVTPQSVPSHVFNGLLSPYPAPPLTTTPTFKRGSVVPLKFNWVNAAGVIVDSAAANPTVAVFPTSCVTQTPTTDPITAEDAGNSGGLRYDASTMTWTFNWSTKPLAAGCFVVRVTPSHAGYAAPPNVFPIALRHR